MHPELLRALAQARHEDLLNRQTRDQPRFQINDHSPSFARLRHRMGTLLIRVGARLIGDHRPPLELARK